MIQPGNEAVASGSAGLNIAERLRAMLPDLTGREARAARYLLANYPVGGLTTVAEFAAASGVSTATILRLVRRLGFQVYGDFQAALRRHLEDTLQSPLVRFDARPPDAGTRPGSILDSVLGAVEAHLREMRSSVHEEDFARVAALVADPRRDLMILGGRYSSTVAAYLARLLMAVRPRVSHISGQTQTWPQHLLEIGRRSVVIVFDVRRYQPDVIAFAEAAERQGATVVLFTDVWRSPAARHAEHVLCFPVASPSVFDMLAPGMALAEALVADVALRLGEGGRARMARLEEMRRPFGAGAGPRTAAEGRGTGRPADRKGR